MFHKMLMTGALCIIGQGSAVQPLVAILFQLFFLLVVLKLAPYESDGDDWASIVTSLTIVLTLLSGFALVSDDSEDPAFDNKMMGVLLIVLFGFTMMVQVGIMVFMDCGVLERIQEKCRKRQGVAEKAVTQTKVTPTTESVDGSDGGAGETVFTTAWK